MTKQGYRLFLVAYCVKSGKWSATDKHASISRIFAGGVYDLGSSFCNLAYVNTDVRNIQSSMVLSVFEFENSVVTHKQLQDLINSKETTEMKSTKSASNKESYLTFTFKSELSELSFKSVKDKFGESLFY